jgi:hypothetical protein
MNSGPLAPQARGEILLSVSDSKLVLRKDQELQCAPQKVTISAMIPRMPRNYKRMSTTEDTLAAFLKFAVSSGLPNNRLVPASMHDTRATVTNLFMWLDEFASKNDSLNFSKLLQVWLRLNDIVWPKDVFEKDLLSPGRGRPLSDLGFRALLLSNKLSWRQVAERLVPERFKKDPREAAKYVKDLAKTASRAPAPERQLEAILQSGRTLLGMPAPVDP